MTIIISIIGRRRGVGDLVATESSRTIAAIQLGSQLSHGGTEPVCGGDEPMECLLELVLMHLAHAHAHAHTRVSAH